MNKRRISFMILLILLGSVARLLAQTEIIQIIPGLRHSLIRGKDEGVVHEITDSIYSGKVEIEAVLDSVTKKLKFSKFLLGELTQKSLNSRVISCCVENDKKLPLEFKRLIPSIEEDIRKIELNFTVHCPNLSEYVTTYELQYKVK